MVPRRRACAFLRLAVMNGSEDETLIEEKANAKCNEATAE